MEEGENKSLNKGGSLPVITQKPRLIRLSKTCSSSTMSICTSSGQPGYRDLLAPFQTSHDVPARSAAQHMVVDNSSVLTADVLRRGPLKKMAFFVAMQNPGEVALTWHHDKCPRTVIAAPAVGRFLVSYFGFSKSSTYRSEFELE